MTGREEKDQRLMKECEELIADKEAYMEDFYYTLKRNREMTTVKRQIVSVIRFLNWMMENKGNLNFDNLRENDIDRYLDSIAFRVVDGEKVAIKDGTKANVFYSLTSFFSCLYKNRYIKHNIMADMEKPSIKDEHKQVCMDKTELHEVFQNIELGVGNSRAVIRQRNWKERNYAMILLLTNTGMRISELVNIDVTSFEDDFSRLGVIGKGNKKIHYVLTPMIQTVLKEWNAKRTELLESKEIETNAFFLSNQLKRISDGATRKMLNIYVSTLDKHITPHKFRSTFITMLYEQTGDIYLVAEIVGHNQVETTKRYIADDLDEKKRKASEMMANIVLA